MQRRKKAEKRNEKNSTPEDMERKLNLVDEAKLEAEAASENSRKQALKIVKK